MAKLIHPDYLRDQESFRACRNLWGELFAEAEAVHGQQGAWKGWWSKSRDEEYELYGNGTRVHCCDDWRQTGGIGTMITRVHPQRERGVMVQHAVSWPPEMTADIAYAEFKVERASWQTDWTTSDIEVLHIWVMLAEENLNLVKSALSVWIDPATGFEAMRETLEHLNSA